MFLGYHSNLDEDSTISPTGAQSLSYSRSCLFLPPPPRYPNSLHSRNPPQSCLLTASTGSHGRAPQRSDALSNKLQTVFAIETLPPPPRSLKRISSAWESGSGDAGVAGSPAARRSLGLAHPSARGSNHSLVINSTCGARGCQRRPGRRARLARAARPARALGHTPRQHPRECAA